MLTFICSTLKRCGVHLVIKSIRGINVFMRITGRISGEHLRSTNTQVRSVQRGPPRKTQRLTRMDASWSIDAVIAMGGKSLSTTRATIRHGSVGLTSRTGYVKSSTALTTTVIRRNEL
jgi:hypothetical protein